MDARVKSFVEVPSLLRDVSVTVPVFHVLLSLCDVTTRKDQRTKAASLIHVGQPLRRLFHAVTFSGFPFVLFDFCFRNRDKYILEFDC